MSFPVIFIFIAFAMCNVCKSEDELKTVLEGDEVQLNFPYLCNSTRVTLQYSMNAPFYTFTDHTESIVLLPVQVHRFTFKNKSEDDHCSLNVILNPVMRVDAGTYIFFAYIEDGIYESSFKRIGLDVDFLPGKASCTLNEEYTVGNWVTLNCMAPVGSLSSQIDCYQNGEKMPPITPPTETLKHLKQSIHVKKENPVFCCTSTWEYTKDLCDCNDFQWDLANDKIPSSIIDPCGPTIPAHDQTQTGETPLIPSNATSVSTEATIFKIHDSNVLVIWISVVSILSSIVIIGLVILVIVLKLRSKKKKREASKICKHKLTNSRVQSPRSKSRKTLENQCMLQRSISV